MTSRNLASGLGLIVGAALAPVAAFGALLRRTRVFHPRGVVLRGTARAVEASGPHREVGLRLRGVVIVRFSGAWWKKRQWPDVLGCAIRFTRSEEHGIEPLPHDQDLLLATVRTPLTTLLAPMSTHVDDFLDNNYFGVAPFEVPPLGRVKLRLRMLPLTAADGSREQRMLRAVALGRARAVLEARPHKLFSEYQPIAEIELTEISPDDEKPLRFDPFKTGRGLQPVGFVHHMRTATYLASFAVRKILDRDPESRRPSHA